MISPSNENLAESTVLEKEITQYNQIYERADWDAPIPKEILPAAERPLWDQYIGSIKGKTVLECGAGDGLLTLWLASRDARVLAVEISPVGCEVIRARAQRAQLANRVEVYCGDCCQLETMMPMDSIDVVVGASVLHHLPLSIFGTSLRKVLKPGAVGLFFENSNANPLYRFARRVRNNETACGSPLTFQEADTLISAVGDGDKIFPRFGLFELMPKYVFQSSPTFAALARGIDRMIDKVPGTRAWSAHMWVYVRKPPEHSPRILAADPG